MISPSLKAPQESLTGTHSISRLLQQTQALAALLKQEDLRHWTAAELQGFADNDDPPGYRKVSTHHLEVYNADRDSWLDAGILNYTFAVRQSIAQLEVFSREVFVPLPVAKNFSIKNDFGDSFASDWPQRFMVRGSEYETILKAVVDRWTGELQARGLQVSNFERFTRFLDATLP